MLNFSNLAFAEETAKTNTTHQPERTNSNDKHAYVIHNCAMLLFR